MRKAYLILSIVFIFVLSGCGKTKEKTDYTSQENNILQEDTKKYDENAPQPGTGQESEFMSVEELPSDDGELAPIEDAKSAQQPGTENYYNSEYTVEEGSQEDKSGSSE